MENGESVQHGAAREAMEEALAHVQIGSLLAVVNVLRAHQVHIMFRARLDPEHPQFGVGPESLETQLYAESRDSLAARSPFSAWSSRCGVTWKIAATAWSGCISATIDWRATGTNWLTAARITAPDLAQCTPAAAIPLSRSPPMTFVVTENCIKCKYTDCVEVCPVDCFHEGPNFLVIDPDECIDCTLCEPECPVEAIFSEEELPAGQEQFRSSMPSSPRTGR